MAQRACDTVTSSCSYSFVASKAGNKKFLALRRSYTEQRDAYPWVTSHSLDEVPEEGSQLHTSSTSRAPRSCSLCQPSLEQLSKRLPQGITLLTAPSPRALSRHKDAAPSPGHLPPSRYPSEVQYLVQGEIRLVDLSQRVPQKVKHEFLYLEGICSPELLQSPEETARRKRLRKPYSKPQQLAQLEALTISAWEFNQQHKYQVVHSCSNLAPF